MSFNPSEVRPAIFHGYDVRGNYPEEVNEEVFFRLAQAIQKVLRPRKVVIGHDSRLSSPVLARALADGFLNRGATVINAGLITSPLASWIARKKKMFSLMVTASHNEPGQNGLKIYSPKRGAVAAKNGLKTIENAFNKTAFEKLTPVPESVSRRDFIPEYQQYLIKLLKRKPPNIKIAVDYSNGTAGLVLNGILDRFGAKATTLNEAPNGAFPGHGPNPLHSEAHKQIKWLLKNEKYRLGVIFDGDGDRLAFFDEKGELVPPARILCLLADFYLPKTRVKNVVVAASFSRVIRDVVKKHGGKVYFSAVGRTNMAPLMKKKRALVGAENSGHYFFKDFDFQDGGILALLKVLEVLEFNKKIPLSKLVVPYQIYVTLPEKSFGLIPGTGEMVLRRVRAVFFGGKASKLDGLTVEYSDWWFNLRPSRTEPVWRLSIEGKDREILNKNVEKIESIVKSFRV